MVKRKFLVTGALPYSNNRLHVGHMAGAYVPADIFVRYLRSRGDDVLFICGSDDNGVAIEIAAQKEGTTPAELSGRYHALQAPDFAGLGINFDVYGGTHQPDYVDMHTRLSQEFFRKIYDNGHFVKKTTDQWYDVKAQRFLPDRYVYGTCYHKKPDGTPCGYEKAFGDQCESCGNSNDPLLLINPKSVVSETTPEKRQTAHWYLSLGKFEGLLADWLDQVSMEWRPIVANFARSKIKDGLPERAMTRDLKWGIPVPLEDPDAAGKVLYVWFDAPIGYVSFTAAWCEKHQGDWKKYQEWWQNPDCRIYHFIGEDNMVFHTLIWPSMLLGTRFNDQQVQTSGEKYHAATESGVYQLPSNVVANAFLNIKFPGKDEEKISKSRGTAVWIGDFLKMCDPDPLRYYLTINAPESQRTAWSFEEFVERNNSELIAALGNFVNRWQKIVTDDFGRKLPEFANPEPIEHELLAMIRKLPDEVGVDIEATRFKAALGRVMEAFRACNRYIDTRAPWTSRKTDAVRTGTTIHTCIQAVRTLGVLLEPFMPFAAEKIRVSLNVDAAAWTWLQSTEPLAAGHSLGPIPEVLFRKLDLKEFATAE